jgi:hypothetical protein
VETKNGYNVPQRGDAEDAPINYADAINTNQKSILSNKSTTKGDSLFVPQGEYIEHLGVGNTDFDQDGNYRTFVDSNGCLVKEIRESGVWNVLTVENQTSGDKKEYRPNRGYTVGSPFATEDTELTVGGDSTVDGMVVATSDDGINFTDVTSIAASDTGSTYPTWSNNPQTGAVDLVGSDFCYCNIKAKTATVGVIGTGTVIREYYSSNDTWDSFPLCVNDADDIDIHRANRAGTVVGSEQWRFYIPDAKKLIINIDGTDYEKFWTRLRVTSPLTTSPTIEQVKVGPSRFEANSNGATEYTGEGVYKKTLDITELYNLDGAVPGSTDIEVSPNVTIKGLANTLSDNQLKGKVGVIQIPVGCDTSRPLKFIWKFFGTAATAGDVQFLMNFSQFNVGDSYDGLNTENNIDKIISIGIDEDTIEKSVEFEIDIQDIVWGGDVYYSIYRDAVVGNANDTYSGNIVLTPTFTSEISFFKP